MQRKVYKNKKNKKIRRLILKKRKLWLYISEQMRIPALHRIMTLFDTIGQTQSMNSDKLKIYQPNDYKNQAFSA